MQLVNIEHIYSDRRYLIDFAIRNKDGTDPDWSAYTNKVVRFVVKRNQDDADSAALIHKSTTLGITMSGWNPPIGQIELTTDNTARVNLPNGRYFWELIFECTELVAVEVDMGVLQVTESVVEDSVNLPAEV
jgi:hypothetical protein